MNRKRTSSVVGDPARKAALNRGDAPVLEAEGMQQESNPRANVGKKRVGATVHSPRLQPGADPGDAAAVASAHRSRSGSHKKDTQALKR